MHLIFDTGRKTINNNEYLGDLHDITRKLF